MMFSSLLRSVSLFWRKPESLVFYLLDSGFRQNDVEWYFTARVTRLAFLLLLLISLPSLAVIEDREFADPVQAQRYQSLIEELRCPKCQNQNIADSDAEIAEDLRNEIYRQLREGKSDKEIVDYLVARYGEFVNYRPPLDSNTVLLWAAPGVLLFIGVLIWLRRFAVKKSTVSQTLSEQEQQRLRELLQSSASENVSAKQNTTADKNSFGGDRS